MRATPLPITHPHLIQEWHPSKNDVTMEQVFKGSVRLVWWKGECGHEWEASPASRSRAKASGCPYCSGRKAIPGVNDFTVEHPLLALQWHPTKNIGLDPTTIKSGSQKSAWWRGDCGHEWEALIRNRVRGAGCHICRGKAVVAGINDLQTTSPLLATFWNYDKNGAMLPTNITDKSDKLAHWICNDGHEWSKPISRMLGVQRICPVCHNRKSLIGHNDLETTHPELALQWDTLKNATVSLSEITANMDATVWWLCGKGHSWSASIASRTHGNGCPVCSGRQVLKGFNDLATIKPHIAQEWHPTLNGELTADMVTRASNKRVWWTCLKNHEWQAKILDRTISLSNCPVCAAAQTISRGEQEIADFIEELGFAILQSDRQTLDGLELDIYIPSKNIAIEYNGIYWHSDLFRDKNYHYDKWMKARGKGIQLIQIWEDEWSEKSHIIKSMLRHKLGCSDLTKYYARKLNIVQVSSKDAQRFFNNHHIQGFAAASFYYALTDKGTNNAVSMIALKKEGDNNLNIIRYATAANTIGGFTKLLKHAERQLSPDMFITFSDNCVSDGALYRKSNFVADRELSPDYRYMVNGERKHKFGYRLKRFKNDENLQWIEGYSERQLAQLNNIPRIWDAGKTRWVKKIN